MGDIDRTILYIGEDDSLARRALSSLTGHASLESAVAVSEATETLDGPIACVVAERAVFEEVDAADLSTRGADPPVIVLTRGQESATTLLENGAADVVDRERPGAETLLARRLDHLLTDHSGLEAVVEGSDAGTQTGNRSERLVDTLLGALDDAFYMLDTSGDLIRWNDRLVELSGYSEATFSDMTATDFFDGEDEDRVLDAIERIRRKESVRIEVEMTTADGGSVPIEFSGAPLTDEAGNVRAILGTGRDMTDKREREQELRRANTILNVLGDPVYAVDDEGRYSYVNDAFVDHTGYSRSEAIGAHASKVTPEEEIERGREIIQRLVSEDDLQSITWEMDRVTADGERIPTENHTALLPFEDGEFQGSVGVIRDITERKERERELRLKTRAIEEAPVGVTISDPHREDNPIVYANGHFQQLTGYREDEILGRNCRHLQGPATDSELVAELREAVDEPHPVTVELRNYRKDGTEFWNRVTVAPVRDDAGELTNFVGFQEDITERKEREQELTLKNRAMDEAPIGITIHDGTRPGCPITYANSGFEAVTGYEPGAVEGSELSMLSGAETDERTLADLDTAFDEADSASVVVLLYREDGTPFWARVSLTPVRNEDGVATHFVGSLQDVTTIKEHEQQVARRLEEFGDLLAEDLQVPVQEARSTLGSVDGGGDTAAVEQAADSLERVESLIEDLTTVHARAVTSREVEEETNATGGSAAEEER